MPLLLEATPKIIITYFKTTMVLPCSVFYYTNQAEWSKLKKMRICVEGHRLKWGFDYHTLFSQSFFKYS